jgi:hypothetical protein
MFTVLGYETTKLEKRLNKFTNKQIFSLDLIAYI